MAKLSEDQIVEIQETFNLFDQRGDNKIAAHQLGDVLRALSQNPTESEIRKCGYASNPDARISSEVFLPIWQTVSKNRHGPATRRLHRRVRVFDKDQNFYISSAN
ncbi:LOW QUALITY PROTEIN: myosin-2 essential light chain-like [Haliotis rubra]|uniref:LOW QUALITY PROTEIN: myosin-2 essential light chain-like n=1 Tax=Haliotis rubra TaxID=36100 RepID=UPI001EE4F3EE|nr:LOW QUALITY PROTEIN: myosin-2 essential light chain-like [Haliotis rubra]